MAAEVKGLRARCRGAAVWRARRASWSPLRGLGPGLGLFIAVLAAGPAQACRCADPPLATHWAKAQVVLQAEVERVEPVAGDGGGAAHLRAQVRVTQGLKNASGLRHVHTAASSAACGLPLQPGQRWWIFATLRSGKADVHVDSCHGSRPVDQDFQDVPASEAPRQLAAWAAALACPSPSPLDIARRMALDALPRQGPLRDGLLSPNGAYRALSSARPAEPTIGGTFQLRVDTQGPTMLGLAMRGVAGATPMPMPMQWINEKLLFLQVPWHDGLRSDLVLDVETRTVVSVDTARKAPGTDRWRWLDPDCRTSR